MQTGTYKLVRVKNHYHIAGEKCYHVGRTPNKTSPKRQISRLTHEKAQTRLIGTFLCFLAFMGVLSLPFQSSTVLYQKAYAQDVNEIPHFVDKPVEDLNKTESIRPETVKEKIYRIAENHDISPTKLDMIVRLESHYIRTAEGDMDIICKRTGKPVRARGPVQITECFHPEVSDENAFDWEYSLNWAAEKIASKQCGKEWTTCRK